jgi:hypothetical protein
MIALMDTDTLITGNCLGILATLPAGVVDLAYMDPPFNTGIKYPGYNDRREPPATAVSSVGRSGFCCSSQPLHFRKGRSSTPWPQRSRTGCHRKEKAPEPRQPFY